ncbi:hypothetical protein ACFQ1M_10060 [Sungkyunkwania multivorans]|uniref:Phage abortive infection protein n=1 Tax=Sungkyunkwania multivorans TaxID=1173618 RepID=A0ABW3CXM7_9FLAO
MTEWFNNLDVKLQVIIISSITSLTVFMLGWFFKVVYDRFSLTHKMKKEFEFEQRKKLKEEIAKNKTHFLNSIESLNHRMWNFSQNVDKNWHKISKEKWFETDDQYYINSFVYRFLCFLHWTLKTEKDTISVDTTIADKEDVLYLKWVKTFKDIFTDADLLQELNYDNTKNTNHFYKNDLIGYSKWVVFNHAVIDFDEFETKLQYNYEPLEKVIEYFTQIEGTNDDKNLNVLRCYHLLAIQFLNDYGHDYQKTDDKKIKRITDLYKGKIKIKTGFEEFVKKSKLEDEMKKPIRKIK